VQRPSAAAPGSARSTRRPRHRRAPRVGLCAGVAGPVSLDLPEPNRDALALARTLDWTPQFETARMYTGQAPAIDLQRLYGVTTFELG